jgi:hypothetical protein
MTLLPDSERVYPVWRRLVVDSNVRGVQVHDAHMDATTLAHNISHILTLNLSNFLRYPAVTAVHPSDVFARER